MSLFARLHKNKQNGSATAIPAFPLLKRPKQGDSTTQNSRIAPIAVAAANSQKAEKITLDLLAKFRFDLVQRDIDSGYPADDLNRVNNMAWSLMQNDGIDFDAAIKRAAEVVAGSQMAACERAYFDVMALFERLRASESG